MNLFDRLTLGAARVATMLCLFGFWANSAHALGELAPDFTLRDMNGQMVSLSDYKGKVVMINFWATWCQPCQVEMPHIDKMEKELGEKGFAVLSISTDDARSASKVKPLIKRNGYGFTVLLDKESTVVTQYNPGKVLPYTVILDRELRIQNVHTGYNPGDEVGLKEEVEHLLGAAE